MAEVKVCKNEKCENEVVGRVDKQFCSSYCKAEFHYTESKKSGKSVFKLRVDEVLRKNRSILARYNTKSKVMIRKEELMKEGFNPKFFTHYWKNTSGDTYLFCYDQGFKGVKDNGKDKYLLVQWQSYMEKQVF